MYSNVTQLYIYVYMFRGLPWGSAGKESACNAGDLGSIPGLGRSPGEGKGYPAQYSGLENSVDCIVHGSQRAGHDWATFTHSIIYSFSCSFPLELIPGEWVCFPMLYSRLLFVHSVYNSLNLLTPNSCSIPPPPCLATTYLFSFCESVSVS